MALIFLAIETYEMECHDTHSKVTESSANNELIGVIAKMKRIQNPDSDNLSFLWTCAYANSQTERSNNKELMNLRS